MGDLGPEGLGTGLGTGRLGRGEGLGVGLGLGGLETGLGLGEAYTARRPNGVERGTNGK